MQWLQPIHKMAVPEFRPQNAPVTGEAMLRVALSTVASARRRRRREVSTDQHSDCAMEQPSLRRVRLGTQQQPGVLAGPGDCLLLDPMSDPTLIAEREQVGNGRENLEGLEDESPSDSEHTEFVSEPLINEGQLFQDEDEAARQFPEFFEADDGDEAARQLPELIESNNSHSGSEVPTTPSIPHYNLDSQEGREGAADLLDFNYEYLTLLTP